MSVKFNNTAASKNKTVVSAVNVSNVTIQKKIQKKANTVKNLLNKIELKNSDIENVYYLSNTVKKYHEILKNNNKLIINDNSLRKIFINIEHDILEKYEKNFKYENEQLINDSLFAQSVGEKKRAIYILCELLKITKENRDSLTINIYFDKENKRIVSNINKNIFKSANDNMEKFDYFLKKQSNTMLPNLISLFFIANTTYAEKDKPRNMTDIFKNKLADCDDISIASNYFLAKYGYQSKILTIKYKNERMGHTICVFKDLNGTWDYLDDEGVKNTNANDPISLVKNKFYDIERIEKIDISYLNNGQNFKINNIRRIYP